MIPLVGEELSVGKRKVETGRVRVRKTMRKRTETVDQPLISEEFSVERVPIDSPVGEALPAARWEGETMIVPVLEERLAVERQWWIREELHLTRRRRETHSPRNFELRSEEVSVERQGGSGDLPANAAHRSEPQRGLATRQGRKHHRDRTKETSK